MFVTGVDRDFFGTQVDHSKPQPAGDHPWKGRGQGYVTHLSTDD